LIEKDNPKPKHRIGLGRSNNDWGFNGEEARGGEQRREKKTGRYLKTKIARGAPYNKRAVAGVRTKD